jgi:hypothetical protein
LAQKQNAEKLIEFVHDKHPQTRLAAIDALGQCKDEAAYNALIAWCMIRTPACARTPFWRSRPWAIPSPRAYRAPENA